VAQVLSAGLVPVEGVGGEEGVWGVEHSANTVYTTM
jgi:hypothetical protein